MKFGRLVLSFLVVGVGLCGVMYLTSQSNAQSKTDGSAPTKRDINTDVRLPNHKPFPSSSFEIKLPAEDDSSFVDGEKRVLSRTGYPAAIYNGTTKVKKADPETQAREYLSASKSLLGLGDSNIDDLKLHAIRSEDGGSVVRLRQMWKGLPVNKNAEITIHINSSNVVDFVMNGLQYGITIEDVKPLISATTARGTVLKHLGVSARTKKVDEGVNELMILRHQNVDYLVYRVSFILDQPVGEWEAYVDAKTGVLLKVEDIAYYHRAKTAAKRTARKNSAAAFLVNGTGNVFDPDPLTTAVQPYGGTLVDGSDANTPALTAQLFNVNLLDITFSGGTHSLVGPYAQIVDIEAPLNGLFSQASSAFSFNRNADAFEAVMCYYHIDSSMRYLNTTLGVSVTPSQYVGGVKCDPSGLNGDDNSHFTSGNGAVAFGEGGVDDAEDADVIIHELGHGIHYWITAGGLSQVNGLSEGTGDYWAGSYSRFRGFWPVSAGNTAYNWTFNWDGHNEFWNGRILNYAAVYPSGLTGQIHTDGQIWATVNMKIWDDIGRQKADKAFWRGIALTNGASSQNDAANAVYNASGALGYTFAERTAIRNRYIAAGYTIVGAPPTAADVSLSGRVLTSVGGRGVTHARVSITDMSGNVRSVSTDRLGNYRFNELSTGESYIVTVMSRRFSFEPKTISLNDNVAGFDLIAQ